jgi:hypothetical protein
MSALATVLLACPACARDAARGVPWWLGLMLLTPLAIAATCAWIISRGEGR